MLSLQAACGVRPSGHVLRPVSGAAAWRLVQVDRRVSLAITIQTDGRVSWRARIAGVTCGEVPLAPLPPPLLIGRFQQLFGSRHWWKRSLLRISSEAP